MLFLSYSFAGLLAFGSQVPEWNEQYFTTTFQLLLAIYDLTAIQNVNVYAANIFFWSYMILMYTIMLNFLIAIATEVYISVQEKIEDGPTGAYIRILQRFSL